MSSVEEQGVVSFAPHVPRRVWEKLRTLDVEDQQIEEMLADPSVVTDHKKVRELSIKKRAIAPVVEGYRRIMRLERDVKELEQAAKGSDAELAAMAREELPTLRKDGAAAAESVLSSLVTSDDRKVGSVILEIRAGTGGDEACIWARDIMEMYQKYASKRGWSFEVMELSSEASVGGIRSVTINVRGEGVWSEMNFEAGVHSVKRVPATEAQGRIHTSTATVAVLPEPEEVDVKIDWANDVEEGATRAQGPGGQNVNKVETAWQLHHKPSGIIIKMMESKSQQQNRDKARRLLLARLYEAERRKQHEARSAARTAQIGGGDRSEKIRTYRWKEGIAADERLPGEYQLRDLLAGDFSELFKDLVEQETRKRLAEL